MRGISISFLILAASATIPAEATPPSAEDQKGTKDWESENKEKINNMLANRAPPSARPGDEQLSCDELTAEATKLKAQMRHIGKETVDAADYQHLRQKDATKAAAGFAEAHAMLVPGAAQASQDIIKMQNNIASQGMNDTVARMQRMQALNGRLRQVQGLQATRCDAAAPAKPSATKGK